VRAGLLASGRPRRDAVRSAAGTRRRPTARAIAPAGRTSP